MVRLHKVVLKEAEFESPARAHDYLARKLDFPDYYGCNLDALEDCLSDIHTPTRIVLVRDARHSRPWFEAFEEVICESAQRSCFLGCIIRQD